MSGSRKQSNGITLGSIAQGLGTPILAAIVTFAVAWGAWGNRLTGVENENKRLSDDINKYQQASKEDHDKLIELRADFRSLSDSVTKSAAETKGTLTSTSTLLGVIQGQINTILSGKK